MFNFKDRVAIVTGASRGIGKACVVELAKHGADVIVNYCQSKDEAELTVLTIKKLDQKAIAIQADVSKKEDCCRLINQTVKEFGKIDILVNNAGIHAEGSIGKLDLTVWNKLIATNSKSVYELSRLFGQKMQNQEKGVIINIGSIAGFFPRKGNVIYATSKAAIHTLTKGLALALAPKVRVNSVAPGLIETDMACSLQNINQRELVKKSNLRGRIGQPEDIAQIVAFLASDQADWVTGQTIIADGGSSLV